MTGQFTGLRLDAAEPLVGEVYGLRTFRVDESGLLLPLYTNLAWYDGANTATCAPPTGEAERCDHAVPGEDCECGFYAYGTPQAGRRNRQLRYVQAVVACWGRVVAGSQGVRAEHARIEALWLHPKVPAATRRRVAVRYPSARLYADRDAMVAEHPLTALPCYEPPPAAHAGSRAAAVIGGALLLTLGALPMSVLQSSPPLQDLWLAATAATALLAGYLLFAVHGVGHVTAALLAAGVLAWLAAPLLGLAGWVLRAPLLRGLLVAGGGYLLALRPGYFPIVRAERERAFCGVRPSG